MSKLRKEARGKECQVRIPGVCNGNPETTVLAHYSLAATYGRGLKADDEQAAWSCSACHDAVDFRAICKEWSRDELRLMHAEGVLRTQYQRRHNHE